MHEPYREVTDEEIRDAVRRLRVATAAEAKELHAFFLQLTPAQRIGALECLRQIEHGYTLKTAPRMRNNPELLVYRVCSLEEAGDDA